MANLTQHFSRGEFQCRCYECGFDTVDIELVMILERVRDHFGVPVTINSACRCEDHNRRVGGGLRSQHLYGRAADIVVQHVDPDDVADYLERTYPGRYGIGRYNTFTHIDSRSSLARWDMRSQA